MKVKYNVINDLILAWLSNFNIVFEINKKRQKTLDFLKKFNEEMNFSEE